MLGGFGVLEILLVFLLVLLFFGAKRIPEIARSLGLGIRAFKTSVKEDEPDQLTKGNGDADSP